MSSKNKKKFQKPSSLTRLTENSENNQVSLLSRIFGSKKELDNARNNFYKKYGFEKLNKKKYKIEDHKNTLHGMIHNFNQADLIKKKKFYYNI